MTSTNPADFEPLLKGQSHAQLVSVLLELATDHEVVLKRLQRLQVADQPARLAAQFHQTLDEWRRSSEYITYSETYEFARTLEIWLEQVKRELLPVDPPTALALFEAFIEADGSFFERIDDSGDSIGEVVGTACRYWLQAAVRCNRPSCEWQERIDKLMRDDNYGARGELLRLADLLILPR